MSTAVEGIGLLVTNTEEGELADAWLVFDNDHVLAVGTGVAPHADERIDAVGRCVIPGFVDSHTHLVFAGDRSAEFAARMAGAPYAAGGINVTIAATRAEASDERPCDGRRGPLGGSAAGRAPRRSRSSPGMEGPSTTSHDCCASVAR